jgi:hypothetical protein
MSEDTIWAVIEDVTVTIFTIEFALRVYSCPNLFKFFTSEHS